MLINSKESLLMVIGNLFKKELVLPGISIKMILELDGAKVTVKSIAGFKEIELLFRVRLYEDKNAISLSYGKYIVFTKYLKYDPTGFTFNDLGDLQSLALELLPIISKEL